MLVPSVMADLLAVGYEKAKICVTVSMHLVQLGHERWIAALDRNHRIVFVIEDVPGFLFLKYEFLRERSLW